MELLFPGASKISAHFNSDLIIYLAACSY